jgi:hypothetical protein
MLLKVTTDIINLNTTHSIPTQAVRKTETTDYPAHIFVENLGS